MAARRKKGRKASAARRPARRKTARKASRPAARKAARKPPRKTARRTSRKATARVRAEPRSAPAPHAAAPRASSAAARTLVAGAPVEVGVVLHYYPRAAAAVVALSRPLHRGDTIHVRGHTTDFVQPVAELALEGAPVAEGAAAQEIGVRLEQRARAGDRVFRVSW